MKQSVNLYQAALQPRTDKITLPQVSWAFSGLILILVVVIVLLQQQKTTISQQQQSLQQQLAAKTTELANYQQALAQRQPELALQEALQLKQQSNAQKQQLLQYLQIENARPVPQYSLVLAHLAAIDLPGIWLTQFTLGSSQQQFSGVVKDAKLVPIWLAALGKQVNFQGQSFSSVNLKPVNAGYLQFEVAAQPAGVKP